MGIWSQISSKEKRERWAFVGAGIFAILTIGGAAFVYFYPPKPASLPSVENVTAAGGGIAIGGSVSGSTITIAPPSPGDTESKSKGKRK